MRLLSQLNGAPLTELIGILHCLVAYSHHKNNHMLYMGGWSGARTGNNDTQAYYTQPKLAEHFCRIVGTYQGPFVEMGVGDGSIFKKLPQPKVGVEIRNLSPKLSGVLYGVDALTWTPGRQPGVIVMNPPFAKQIEFFNHASTLLQTGKFIIWIAGLNIRLWTNEDLLDSKMHLKKEWLVPPEWSSFSTSRGDVNIRTVVQIWKKQQEPRKLWNITDIPRSLLVCKDQLHPSPHSIIVKRVGTPKDVGKSIPFQNCKNVVRSRNVLKTVYGTLQKGWGTAIAFEKIPRNVSKRFEMDCFYNLLNNRIYSYSLVSLSVPVINAVLSKTWRHLIRHIDYLDGTRRQKHQW